MRQQHADAAPAPPKQMPALPPSLLLLLATLILTFINHSPAAAQNPAAELARSHFAAHGVRLPSRGFTSALRAAALDISPLSCRRSLVVLAMANEEALQHTVPAFLRSMSRITLLSATAAAAAETGGVPGSGTGTGHAGAGLGEQQGVQQGRRRRAAAAWAAWDDGSVADPQQHLQPHTQQHRRAQEQRRMDSAVVLVAWSAAALAGCRALQGGAGGFAHRCVRDAEHAAGSGSFGFHDIGFNSLGFAKIKYILNGLSAGHDVVFLDTDIVLLRDPLPYFLSSDGDMSAAAEKCQVINASLHAHSPELRALGRRTALGLNIGVLYFKATAAVTRCVYNWGWEMQSEVQLRPRVWDQDVYNKVMGRCAGTHGLRWQVLDPRIFQSGCYPGCGCTYRDEEVTAERLGKFSRGHRLLSGGLCGPRHWEQWLLRHFPCSGLTKDKGELMKGLLEGYYGNSTAVITRRARGRGGRP